MNRPREIGYVCGRGHYVFYSDPEGATCGSKREAGIYVEADGPDEEMFYAPGEGPYTAQDYEDNLDECERWMGSILERWQTR